MPEPDPAATPQPDTSGRIPTGTLAATLHERVAAVLRVLETARADAGLRSAPAAPAARALERYRAPLAAAMLALGETLAAFLEADGGPVDFDALRTQFLLPVLVISRSLPLFRRAENWANEKAETAELHRLVLDGRPGGYDAPTLLLDDFYQRGAGAQSLRSRAAALMRMIGEEVVSRGGHEGRTLRILVLGANSLLALGPAVSNHSAQGALSILIVDADTSGLRRARQHTEATLGVRAAVFRADILALATHPGRPLEPFDIVYTLSQYDLLSVEEGVRFTRGIVTLLKPGAALITGTYLRTLPRSTRALATALVGMAWNYWDEETWRHMLGELPFDLETSRFEVLPPATLVVVARRRASERPR